MISTGSCLSGFMLVSLAPPGFRDYSAESALEGEPEDYEFFGTHDELFAKANAGIREIGKTLAPVEELSPFGVHPWLTRMRNHVAEGRREGWLVSDAQEATVQSLIQGLDVQDMDSLRKSVSAVDDFVRAEVLVGRMTPEADALIRLNADYLLRRAEQDPSILKGK